MNNKFFATDLTQNKIFSNSHLIIVLIVKVFLTIVFSEHDSFLIVSSHVNVVCQFGPLFELLRKFRVISASLHYENE